MSVALKQYWLKLGDPDVTDVFELRYVKVVRFTLNCLGAWPNQGLGDTSRAAQALAVYSRCLFLICITAMVFEIKYLKTYNSVLDFSELGHTYITVFMGFLFVMHRRVDKICIIFSAVNQVQMYFGLVLFNMVPMYNNYSAGMFGEDKPPNKTFEHAIFYGIPMAQTTEHYEYYSVITIFNMYLSFTVCCCFCCFDLLLCLIVFHIWGHLNILKHRLRYFSKPDAGDSAEPWRFKPGQSEQVRQELSSIIIYHKMITEFMSMTSRAYSVYLYVYFMFHQVTGCVLLLECSQRTAKAYARYGVLTVVQFQQLIQLSIIFELISTQGESLIDEAYGLPWEGMDVRNRKIVGFFLQRVQKPLAIKAGDMLPVGVKTMVAVIKASLSYFLMLTAFSQDENA